MFKPLPLFLLMLLLAVAPTFAQDDDSAPDSIPAAGIVTGNVRNGTSGGLVPDSGEPMLHIWNGAFQEQEMLHGELASDGSFRFEKVPFVPGWQYAVMFNYQDVNYFSEPATVAEGQEDLLVTLPIYEATVATDAVRVSRQHIFFDAAAADQLLVGEIYVLSNSGDRTVASPADAELAEAPLTFPLPQGAQDVSLDNNTNGRFQLTESGFVDTAPLRPGQDQTQVVVRYTLPYEEPFSYTYSAPWPVDALTVLTPVASGLEVEGEGLVLQESREMNNGGEVTIFSHDALAANESLALHLSGELVAPLPPAPKPNVVSPTSTDTAARSVLPPVLLFLGLTLITFAVWLYRRHDSDQEPVATFSLPPASFDALVTGIALLDEAHEAGRVNESEYAQRRSLLFAQAQQRMPDA